LLAKRKQIIVNNFIHGINGLGSTAQVKSKIVCKLPRLLNSNQPDTQQQ